MDADLDPTPTAPDGGPRPEGVALVETLSLVLRRWQSVDPLPDPKEEPIGKWLTRYGRAGTPQYDQERHRDHCEAFAAFLTHWLNRFRHVTWVEFMTGPLVTPWIKIEPGPRGHDRLCVDPRALRKADPLRWPRPLRPHDVGALLDKSCPHWRPKENSVLRTTVAVLHRAFDDPHAWSPTGEGLTPRAHQALQSMYEQTSRVSDPFDRFAQIAPALTRPLPEGLTLILQDLFTPAHPQDFWGCLSSSMAARLRLYEAIAAPWVAADRFAEALEALDWLREHVGRPTPALTLSAACDRLAVVGRFAGELRPIIAGTPQPSPHRMPLALLLTNFSLIGGLALHVQEAAEALTGDPNPIETNELTRAEGPLPGPAHAPPPGEAPLPTEDDPSSLSELRRIVAEAKTWRDQAANFNAFDRLQQRLDDFEHKWRGHEPSQRSEALARQIAETLSDGLLNSLDQLDRLLPRKGRYSASPLPDELVKPMRRTRLDILDFMANYGGYSEYEIKVGDDASKHAGKYECIDVDPHSSLPSHHITAIEQPGYVRVRNQRTDLKLRPRVYLSP